MKHMSHDHEQLDQHLAEHDEKLDISHREILSRIEELEKKVDNMQEILLKQRSFLAGIIFVVSVLVTLFTLLRDAAVEILT